MRRSTSVGKSACARFSHRQTIDSCVQKRLCSIRRSLDLRYELLVQYESESLLCHTDENTIAHKDIGMWSFFDKLLKQCSTIIRCMVMCQTEVCTWLFLTDRLILLRTIIMRRKKYSQYCMRPYNMGNRLAQYYASQVRVHHK